MVTGGAPYPDAPSRGTSTLLGGSDGIISLFRLIIGVKRRFKWVTGAPKARWGGPQRSGRLENCFGSVAISATMAGPAHGFTTEAPRGFADRHPRPRWSRGRAGVQEGCGHAKAPFAAVAVQRGDAAPCLTGLRVLPPDEDRRGHRWRRGGHEPAGHPAPDAVRGPEPGGQRAGPPDR